MGIGEVAQSLGPEGWDLQNWLLRLEEGIRLDLGRELGHDSEFAGIGG